MQKGVRDVREGHVEEAVLLVGGDKTGRWQQWYREAIPQADRLYAEYLENLKNEETPS